MLAGEYAHEALKRGLAIETRLGTNPYKFGIIGATDSHTSLATAEEDNFFGKHSGYEPKPDRMSHPFMQNENGSIMGWQMVASGLAAVWATENTREAIFDAMQRKEVYGTTHEKIYDVSWSDNRVPANGKLPPVGNTVDVANASWTNTIGAAELATVWTDPDFNPAQKAFYYARVIEIPTPRWSTYDAFRYGIDPPEGAPTSTQERAYTSPIWYTPAS